MEGQYTEKWSKDRRGLFTASSIHLLMGKSLSNQTAQDYIEQKAFEKHYDCSLEPQISTWQMERGTELEPQALDLFELKSGYDLVRDHYQIHPDIDLLASPDAWIRDKGMILENKCPVDILKHIRYGTRVNDAESLKAVSKPYYWQMQAQMLVYNCNTGCFTSYHPQAESYSDKIPEMFAVNIKAVVDDLEFMIERIKEASVIRDQILENL